jgi:hypothetical protein
VRQHGFVIGNIDSNILAEAAKAALHIFPAYEETMATGSGNYSSPDSGEGKDDGGSRAGRYRTGNCCPRRRGNHSDRIVPDDSNSICTQPDRAASCWQCQDRLVRLAICAEPRRIVCHSNRGHRSGTFGASVRKIRFTKISAGSVWIWDEGPDIGGAFEPYRQSERREIYRTHAEKLIERGHAYWCFLFGERTGSGCRSGPAGWRILEVSRPPAAIFQRRIFRNGSPPTILQWFDSVFAAAVIRFRDIVHGDMEFASDVISDPILLRSDGWPTYNYAVVVDDAMMKITHVIRGDDHLSNTPKQGFDLRSTRYAAAGIRASIYDSGTDHTRLSKRHGANRRFRSFAKSDIFPKP